MVCQGNTTALLREAVLFIQGCKRDSPVAPGDIDRLIWGYRLIGGGDTVPVLVRYLLTSSAIHHLWIRVNLEYFDTGI